MCIQILGCLFLNCSTFLSHSQLAGSERSEGDFEDESREKKPQLMRESRFFPLLSLLFKHVDIAIHLPLSTPHNHQCTIQSSLYSFSQVQSFIHCLKLFSMDKESFTLFLIQFSCSSLILSDMKWRNILRKFTS